MYYKTEIEEFCKVFYSPKKKQTKRDSAKMNACIDPAVNRYNQLDEPTVSLTMRNNDGSDLVGETNAG